MLPASTQAVLYANRALLTDVPANFRCPALLRAGQQSVKILGPTRTRGLSY